MSIDKNSFRKIAGIVARYDLERLIENGCQSDEYDIESAIIARRILTENDGNISAIITEVFEELFGLPDLSDPTCPYRKIPQMSEDILNALI